MSWKKRSTLPPFILLLACPLLFASSTTDLTLHDTARARDIPLKIYYPNDVSHAYPLIIFSHGFGGTGEGYRYLGEGWADAGYIVVLPTHHGSDRDALRIERMSGAKEIGKAFAAQQQRTADVGFIISSLQDIERQVPELRDKIDGLRIALGGHSMGAGTALLVAGATAAPPNGTMQGFLNERVKAVLAMSPQGVGEEGFENPSWDHIEIPVMTMSGTQDGGVNGEPPSWRLQPYEHMHPGNKYQVTVNGAGHLSFAVGFRFHRCILRETTAFWDTYLKGDSEAKRHIRSFDACDVDSK